MKMTRIISLALMGVMAFTVFSGCGYRLHSRADLPFREIWVGAIENKTDDPGLQDVLHSAIVEELTRQGVSVTRSSKLQLSGVINRSDALITSDKNGTAVEYRVVTSADFRITHEDGRTEELRKVESPFIVYFSGSADMAGLLASKKAAQERALRDLAMRIAGALIYKK